jgi:hypothetical protein
MTDNLLIEKMPVLDPTAPPCPSWCRLPAGHAYTDDLLDGSQGRGHESKRFGYLRQACITVGNYETRDTDGSLSFTVLVVGVGDLEPEGYIRTEAVELARALLDAAVFIDEIEGDEAAVMAS